MSTPFYYLQLKQGAIYQDLYPLNRATGITIKQGEPIEAPNSLIACIPSSASYGRDTNEFYLSIYSSIEKKNLGFPPFRTEQIVMSRDIIKQIQLALNITTIDQLYDTSELLTMTYVLSSPILTNFTSGDVVIRPDTQQPLMVNDLFELRKGSIDSGIVESGDIVDVSAIVAQVQQILLAILQNPGLSLDQIKQMLSINN